MGMTFKEQVEATLPKSVTLLRIYSRTETETALELIKGANKSVSTMNKVDIKDYFSKLPVIYTKAGETYNALYARISKLYDLGLVEGVDYYNNAVVESTEGSEKYVTLPISKDSYGYYGNMRCYVSRYPTRLGGDKVQRDLTGNPQEYYFSFLRFKIHLVSKVYSSFRPMFVENRLSQNFIDEIIAGAYNTLGGKESYYRDELVASIIIDNFSDDISDIVALKFTDGRVVLLRFKSEIGDLPNLIN